MRLKRTLKKQVEDEGVEVVLSGDDMPCRSQWIVGVNQIANW